MKKLLLTLAILLTVGFTYTAEAAEGGKSTVIKMQINSPIISINGEERLIDEDGTTPVVLDGSTLVPMRVIFEALSAEVQWKAETKVVLATYKGTVVDMQIDSIYAKINEGFRTLEAAPRIINGRAMVPLRFSAESLGATVDWEASTQTITITRSEKFVSLGGVTISITDTQQEVEKLLGKADRIDPSEYEFKWHVYNSDYSKFIMVGIKDGVVEALYTNAKGFSTDNAVYGGKAPLSEKGVTYYKDKFENTSVHAVLIVSAESKKIKASEAVFRAIELQIFDLTNVFRHNKGEYALVYDEIAAVAARKHSQDLAENNYHSHINSKGLDHQERYNAEGGSKKVIRENITSGFFSSADNINAWLNSEGHRKSILDDCIGLGVGFGCTTSRIDGYSATQVFTR